MRLELDLESGDWDDYKQAPLGDLKRVGVVVPTESVGISRFVRLGVLTDEGKPVMVMAPWLIWQAAHRALAGHLRVDQPGHTREQEQVTEPVEVPAVLADVEAAMDDHTRQWDLTTSDVDGTDPDGWADAAKDARAEATAAAMSGELTWAHTLMEAFYTAMAIEDPDELRQALARVAGTAANWSAAINERTADVA